MNEEKIRKIDNIIAALKQKKVELIEETPICRFSTILSDLDMIASKIESDFDKGDLEELSKYLTELEKY